MPGNQYPKILAIVVTYNRLELLQRCVKYLQEQTVKPHILIINNSSPDGTENWLKENQIDHITQPNTGSAGGWQRGMSEGWARQFDYVWMMDDDGYPDPRALEILLGHTGDDVVCVSSLVVKENAPDELVFGLPKINKRGGSVIFSFKRKYNKLSEFPAGTIKYPHLHPFNGTLISLKLAEKVGEVDTSFFMYGDEMDYFYRMKKMAKVFTILPALHFHPDVSQRSIEKKKVYYFIRNTIILNHAHLDKAFLRDILTVLVAMYRIMRRNGFLQFLSYFFGRNAKYFYPAITDGYKKKKGKRFE